MRSGLALLPGSSALSAVRTEQAKKTPPTISTKAAKVLRLTIPQSLLLCANQVIR